MKKIMFILLLAVLLVPLVSAASILTEFDNVVNYEEDDKVAVFDNAFNLPLIGSTIATAERITPQINRVIQGKDRRVMEFEIDSYVDDYIDAIKGLEIKNMKTGEYVDKEFHWEVAIYEDVNVPTYKQECTTRLDANKTQDCRNVFDGYRVENKIVRWERLETTNIPKGKTRIALVTDVENGDYFDGIPILFGKRVKKWATWTESLNVDLLGYWNFDEGSSGDDAVDGVGSNDGICATCDRVAGILGNAVDLDGAAEVMNMSGETDLNAWDEFTVSFWVATDDNTRSSDILGKKIDTFNAGEGWGLYWPLAGDDRLSVYSSGASVGYGKAYTPVNNVFNHFVIIGTGAGLQVFINGTNQSDNGVWAPLTDNPNAPFTVGFTTVTSTYFNGQVDELGLWNRSLSEAEVVQLYNGGVGIQYTNIFPPTVNLNSPDNATTFLSNELINFTGNSTATAPSTIKNMTLFIDNIVNETTANQNITANLSLSIGTHDWNIQACDTNDVCSFGTNRTITIATYSEGIFYYNPITYETSTESLGLNLTTNGAVITDANLVVNGTSHDSTITSLGSDKYNLTSSLNIPEGTGNNTIYFNFTLGGTDYNSTSYQQQVNESVFILCDVTYTTKFLNFTFKDEADDSVLNVSNDLTDVDYWLGDGTYTKSYITSNSTEHFDYPFCFSPVTETATIDMTFKYSKSGYPLRTFVYDDQNLTSATLNKVLYLLSTSDGIYSSISVIESSGAQIQGVTLQIERQFAGVWTLIGQDVTGSDGVATFWVNPNFQHRITATKTAYVTTQVTITPSQTLYTLTMQRTTGDATYTSDLPGIKWVAYPKSGSIDVGARDFNVTVTSSESNLENCKFELVNATNLSQVLGSDESITNSSYCFLEINYNAQANTKFFGKLSLDTTESTGYVVVNADWKWIVIDIDAKGWRSVTSFFADLVTLSEFGEGNEAEFSRIVTFFLIATIIFGVFIYFSGVELTSPGVTILLIWGITLFASAGGFLTFSSGSSNVNPTIEQYGFFFIFTIYMVNYFLTILRRANE